MKYLTEPLSKSVTAHQYQNAMKLADFLEQDKLSGSFDMKKFVSMGAYSKDPHVCGTVACGAGYMPEAFKEMDLVNYKTAFQGGSNITYNFELMMSRLLGLNDYWKETRWCFDKQWVWVDNTPVGVAKRIKILYNQGLPETWREQLEGREILMYI